MRTLAAQGFALILGSALVFGLGAYGFGLTQQPDPETSALADFAVILGVDDVAAFVRVAYIHNAGYLGGVLGLLAAAYRAARLVRSW